MHELSFAESTLELALRRAQEAGAQRVVGLHLVVGEFTLLEPTSLDFYWERITQGTAADGSRISVRRVLAQLTCLDCGRPCDPGDESWTCRACGSERLQLTSGDECYLEAIDVEGSSRASAGAATEPGQVCEAESSSGSRTEPGTVCEAL